MRWPNLVRKARKQPARGTWHEWKQKIADDCDGQCVYCAIAEARFGGIRNFHVEHFRPKKKFPKLENRIQNLYLACAICNVLKSDDWPCEPASDHSRAAYPDPVHADFNALFAISPQTYAVDSATIAGKYVIEKVLLNRAQLIVQRRLDALLRYREEFDAWVSQSIKEMTDQELRQVVGVLQNFGRVQTHTLIARPYRDADAKRLTGRSRSKRAPQKR
jgi:hypothetical protein